MGFIQDLIQRYRAKKEMERAEKEGYIRQRQIEQGYQQKQTSHYERELLAWQEAQRQKKIKETVQQITAMENRKNWQGIENNAIYAPNVIANHPRIFSGQNIFANAPKIVKTPNVVNAPNITNAPNIFLSRRLKSNDK